jgi:hypothetical protein
MRSPPCLRAQSAKNIDKKVGKNGVLNEVEFLKEELARLQAQLMSQTSATGAIMQPEYEARIHMLEEVSHITTLVGEVGVPWSPGLKQTELALVCFTPPAPTSLFSFLVFRAQLACWNVLHLLHWRLLSLLSQRFSLSAAHQ